MSHLRNGSSTTSAHSFSSIVVALEVSVKRMHKLGMPWRFVDAYIADYGSYCRFLSNTTLHFGGGHHATFNPKARLSSEMQTYLSINHSCYPCCFRLSIKFNRVETCANGHKADDDPAALDQALR